MGAEHDVAEVAGKTALVTGATGFVGGHVVAALRRLGWGVRLAVRSPGLSTAEDSIAVGDISSKTDWRAALQGIDLVVHMAARAHRSAAVQEAERDLYFETNTRGTLRLARAAVDAGTRHFFFMSSVAVNGTTTDRRTPFCESDPPAPKTVYGESKAAAEQGLAELSAATAMPIVIARPPMVYGQGARGNFSLLLRAVRAGIPLPFRTIANRRAFIAVENLSDFVLHMLSVDIRGCETFLVADDDQVSTPDFIRALARALGRSPHLVPLPVPALGLLARVAGRPELLDSLCGSLEVNQEKARATGWRPPLTLSEGLAAAVVEPNHDDRHAMP
jgi:UDP-glucose 4-epimerase